MVIACVVFLVLLVTKHAAGLSGQRPYITSVPGTFTVDHNASSVLLDCSFNKVGQQYGTQLILTWSKLQRRVNGEMTHEETIFSFMSPLAAVLEKVPDIRTRYSASVIDTAAGGSYVLNIKDPQPYDSGIFRCRLLNENGSIAFIDHELVVQVPPSTVAFHGARSNSTSNQTPPSTSLHYVAGRADYLECRATGAYPRPTLSVSPPFPSPGSTTTALTYVNGSRPECFQQPSYEAVLAWKDVIFQAEDDGREMTCVVTLGTDSWNVTSILNVDGAPFVSSDASLCPPTQLAMPGDANAPIFCHFHARPAAHAFWKNGEGGGVDLSGQTQTTVELDGHNDYVARLIFPKVFAENYTTYTLNITNSVGSTTVTIVLAKGRSSASTSDATRNLNVYVLHSFINCYISLAVLTFLTVSNRFSSLRTLLQQTTRSTY